MDIINHVDINFILDRVKRDYPYDDKHTDPTNIVEWVADVLEKLPINQVLVNKVTDCSGDNDPCLIIEDYKAELPCDCKRILQLNLTDYKGRECKIPLKKATGLFINHKEPDINFTAEYSVQNNIIQTTVEYGKIEMSYLATPLDGNGFPLIPDEEVVIDAIVKYIAFKIDYILLRLKQISPNIYSESKAQYDTAFRKAKGQLHMPDEDDMYNIGSNWIKIGTSLHDRQFNYRFKGNYGR